MTDDDADPMIINQRSSTSIPRIDIIKGTDPVQSLGGLLPELGVVLDALLVHLLVGLAESEREGSEAH